MAIPPSLPIGPVDFGSRFLLHIVLLWVPTWVRLSTVSTFWVL